MKKARREQLRRIAAMRFELVIDHRAIVDVTMEQMYLIVKFGHEGNYTEEIQGLEKPLHINFSAK